MGSCLKFLVSSAKVIDARGFLSGFLKSFTRTTIKIRLNYSSKGHFSLKRETNSDACNFQ